jgi:PAS domain S-box-containing protein
MENSPVAVFVPNTEGKYEYVNEAASELLGYSTKELMGMSIQQVTFVEESKVFSAVKSTGCASCETVLRSKDGLPVQVNLNSVRLPDGKLMAFCENITERKKNEEQLKESIQRNELINEKLSVVGRLTRHDVGNKLMVMKSNIYLLKKQIADNPKLSKYLEGIDSAINQSNEMFEFSRFYEEIGVEEPSEIDVVQCFNQAVALLPNLGTIKIVNDCQGLRVTADSMLKQLFYNFIDNSIKHGEKVTQIRLHYTEDKNGVKLFYEDNGVGVLEVNKPKLFEVGFTTGKGSGLGLYLVKKMMDVYGWEIKEIGEPGKGAKFTITIPKLNKNGKENYQIAK